MESRNGKKKKKIRFHNECPLHYYPLSKKSWRQMSNGQKLHLRCKKRKLNTHPPFLCNFKLCIVYRVQKYIFLKNSCYNYRYMYIKIQIAFQYQTHLEIPGVFFVWGNKIAYVSYIGTFIP